MGLARQIEVCWAARQRDGSRHRREQAGQSAQQGRFADAIAPGHDQRLAARQMKVDIIQNPSPATHHAEPGDL